MELAIGDKVYARHPNQTRASASTNTQYRPIDNCFFEKQKWETSLGTVAQCHSGTLGALPPWTDRREWVPRALT